MSLKAGAGIYWAIFKEVIPDLAGSTHGAIVWLDPALLCWDMPVQYEQCAQEK